MAQTPSDGGVGSRASVCIDALLLDAYALLGRAHCQCPTLGLCGGLVQMWSGENSLHCRERQLNMSSTTEDVEISAAVFIEPVKTLRCHY